MGCNTSQELKTKDGSSTGVNGTTAAVGEHNGENVTSEQNCNNEDAQQHQNGGDMGQEGMKSLATTKTPTTESSKTQHSINSNGDATNIKHLNSSSLPPMAKENGSIPQNSCNKAEISELNDMDDMGEDEEIHVAHHHHHHHHGSTKIRRNPLKNLDLDFKFDVNSF